MVHVELLGDRGGVQRPGAAEGEQGELARVDAALDCHHAHRARHLGARHARDSRGGLGHVHPERLGEAAHGALGGVPVELDAAGERRVAIEVAEQQVGVGHRRLLPAAAVAGRARVGPGRVRAHAERAAGVAPGDAAAAGAHGVDVHHRQRERAPADVAPACRRDVAVTHERHVARRAAHVEAHRVLPGAAGGADGAAGGPRQHRPRSVPGRRRGVGHAAARQHHLRQRQPGVACALGQPLEIAPQQRREGGVDDRRRAALVLAEHARGLVRGRDVHARRPPARRRGARARGGGTPRAGTRPRTRRRPRPAPRGATSSSSSSSTPSGPQRSRAPIRRSGGTSGGGLPAHRR